MSPPDYVPPSTESDLARAWALLTPPRSTELTSFPVATLPNGLACRVALDRVGLRHLLVPAVGETIAGESTASVLSSVVRSLHLDAEPVVHLDIHCTERDLDAEFDEVIEDLLEQVRASSTPGGAALSALERWRRLFRTRLVRGLSGPARIGLFAELTVLHALLASEPHLAVETWTGPLGRPHDFEAPGRCLEVKAVGDDAAPVVINGIDQLDTHDNRDLDLLLLTVVPDPQGTTLTALIDSVRGVIADPQAFDLRLRRLGWQPGPIGSDTEGFAVGGLLRVPITETTPRVVPAALVSGRLPDGVDGVSYRIERDVLAVHSGPGTLSEIATAATTSVAGCTPPDGGDAQ